jgi:hypothetical protein
VAIQKGGHILQFWVPGKNSNMRCECLRIVTLKGMIADEVSMLGVGHSCNGFSAGVDTDSFNGPDPLWEDLLRSHSTHPIHVVIGGGDQIYCDALSTLALWGVDNRADLGGPRCRLAREPEMQEWIGSPDAKWKTSAPLTDEMTIAWVVSFILEREGNRNLRALAEWIDFVRLSSLHFLRRRL